MERSRKRFGGLLLAAALLSSLGVRAAESDCDCDARQVGIVGHRGSGTNTSGRPQAENTLPSFDAAIDAGAKTIELDLRLTSDGELVVMHDASAKRTTGRDACVSQMTAAEIAALDAGVGTAQEGKGVRVPSFADVLGHMASRADIEINAELKTQGEDGCPATDPSAIADAAEKALRPFDGKSRVIVSSFEPQALEAFRAKALDVRVALLSFDPADVATAKSMGCVAIQFSHLVATPEAIGAAHEAGLEVHVWTVDVESTMQTMIERKVDRIITNEVGTLKATIQALCREACAGAEDVSRTGC